MDTGSHRAPEAGADWGWSYETWDAGETQPGGQTGPSVHPLLSRTEAAL